MLVPLHRENITSYLSPILGQYGIRNSDFLNNFVEEYNKQTNFIFANEISTENVDTHGLSDFELTVPVRLTVYKGGKYKIKTLLPHVGSLFSSYFTSSRRFVRKEKSYRNFNKLLKLASIRANATGFNPSAAGFNKAVKDYYGMIRNTLHKKR